MPTPKLEIQALVDFILKASSVDDTALVRAVERSLKNMKVPEIDLSPTLKLNEKLLSDKYRKEIKSVEREIDAALKSLDDRLKKSAESRRKEGVDPKQEKQIAFRTNEAVDHLRQVKKGFSDVYTQLNQLSNSKIISVTGKDLRAAKALTDQLRAGNVELSKLRTSDKQAALEVADAYRQRAAQLKQFGASARNIFRNVQKEQETATGGKVFTQEMVPPLLLSGLGPQADKYTAMAKEIEGALDPEKAKRYGKELGEIERIVGGTRSEWAKINGQLRKISGTDVYAASKDGYKELKKGTDYLKQEFKKIQKIPSFTDRANAVSGLYKDLTAKEKEIHKFRDGLESKSLDHRRLEMGRYLKDFDALSRSVVHRATAAAGQELLKGRSTTSESLKDFRGLEFSDRDKVVEALKGRVKDAAGALVDYSSKADQAALATDREFLSRQKVLDQHRKDLSLYQDEARRAFREETPAGKRRVVQQQSKLDLGTGKQLDQLDDVVRKFDDLDKKVKETGKDNKGLDDLNNRLKKIKGTASQLKESLSMQSILGDGIDRDRVVAANKAVLSGLKKNVKDFRDDMVKETKASAKALDQAAVTRGQQYLSQGDVNQRLREAGSVNTLRDAEAFLTSERNKATRALGDYERQARATGNYNDEYARKVDGLRGKINALDTSLYNTTDRLRKLGSAQTDTGMDKARKDVDGLDNSIRRLATSSEKSINSIRRSAVGLGLPHEQMVGMLDVTDNFRERLSKLQDQARRDIFDNDSLEGQRKGLDKIRAGLTGLKNEISGVSGELDKIKTEQQVRSGRTSSENRAIAEGRGDDILRQRADAGERELARATPLGPIHGLPALAIAAQNVDLSKQADLSEALRMRRESVDLRQKEAEAAGKLNSKMKEGFDAERRGTEQAEQTIQKRREQAGLVEKEVEGVRNLQALGKKVSQQTYGMDPDHIKNLNEGIFSSIRAFDYRAQAITAKMANMEKVMGSGPAKASAEYKKLSSQLRTVNERTEQLKRSSRELNKQFGASGDLMRGMTPQELLALSHETGKQAVARAGRGDTDKGVENIARSVGSIDKGDLKHLADVRGYLQTQLAANASARNEMLATGVSRQSEEFKKAEAGAQKLEKAIGKVNVRARGYEAVTRQIGGLFRQFARYGIGYAALYQALFGVKALISGVVELDSALISIKAITQSTNEEMLTIENSIKRVALVTKFTTGEIAAAGQVLAQAGVEAKDFPAALSSVAMFAAATESSMKVSADLVSTMRNVFKDLGDLNIANQLTQAVNISKLTAEDLKTILSLSAQMAKNYQLTSDQYLAAVSTMRNAGIKASTVATGLRQALIEVFSPDTKTLKVLQNRYASLGEKTDKDSIRDKFFGFSQTDDPLLSVLQELRRVGFGGSGKAIFSGRTFDVRAENAVNSLITNLDEYAAAQAKVVFGNAAVTASVTQMESLSNSSKNLGAAFIATSHDLTQDVLPGIEDFIDALTESVESIATFNSWLKATSGDGVGSSILAGTAAAAVAGRYIPAKASIPQRILRYGGSFIGGTAAGAGAEAVAAENGLGETTSSLLSLAAGSAIGGLLSGGLGGLGDKFKGLKDSKMLGPLSKVFGGMSVLFGGIAKLAAPIAGALRFVPGVGWVIAGLYTLFELIPNLLSDDIENARTRLNAANKRRAETKAVRNAVQDELEAFTPSGDGFIADPQRQAGRAESLQAGSDLVNAQLEQFFSANGDVPPEKMKELKRLVTKLNESAYDKGTEAWHSVIAQIDKLSGLDITGTEGLEKQFTDMQQALGKVTNETGGMFEELKNIYEKYSDPGEREKVIGTVNGALADSLELAVKDTGLTREVQGLADYTTDQALALFKALGKRFVEVSATLESAEESVDNDLAAQQLQIVDYVKQIGDSSSPAETAKAIRLSLPVPTTAEDYKFQEMLLEAIQQRVEELEKIAERRFFSQKGRSLKNIDRLDAAAEEIQLNLYRYFEVADKTAQEVTDDLTRRVQDYKAFLERAEQEPKIKQVLEGLESLPDDSEVKKTYELLKQTYINSARNAAVTASEILTDISDEVGANKKILSNAFNKVFGTITNALVQNPPKVKESGQGASFEEKPASLAKRQQIALLEVEIMDRRRNRNFIGLDELINKKKGIILSLLDDEEAFWKNKTAGTGREKQQVQKNLNRIAISRIRAERNALILVDANAKRILDDAKKRINEEIKELTSLAKNLSSHPFYTDTGKFDQLDDQYKASVQKLVGNIEDRVKAGELTRVEADRQIAALKASSASLFQVVNIHRRLSDATDQYIKSLSVLYSPQTSYTQAELESNLQRAKIGVQAPAEERIDFAREQSRLKKDQLSAEFKLLNHQLEAVRELSKKDELTPGETETKLKLTVGSAKSAQDIQDLQLQIAGLEDYVEAVSLNISHSLKEGFDLSGIMSDLRADVEGTFKRMSGDIRASFVDLFDGIAGAVSDSLTDSLADGESPRDALLDVVHGFNRQIGAALIEAPIKKGLYSIAGSLFPETAKELEEKNRDPIDRLGDIFKQQNKDLKTGTMNVQAGVVHVGGSGTVRGGAPPFSGSEYLESDIPGNFGGPEGTIGDAVEIPEGQNSVVTPLVRNDLVVGTPLGPQEAGAIRAASISPVFGSFGGGDDKSEVEIDGNDFVSDVERDYYEKSLDGLTEEKGFWSSMSDGLGSIGDGIAGAFSGVASLFGIGVGPQAAGDFNTAMTLISLSAKKGGVVNTSKARKGFSGGGIINGPGTATSDSVNGVIVDAMGKPVSDIRVSNKEGILTGKAVEALTPEFVHWINKNAPKFANGGIVGSQLSSAVSGVTRSSTKGKAQAAKDPDVNRLADSLIESMQSQGPQDLRLLIDSGAVNRTMRDILEEHFADTMATR